MGGVKVCELWVDFNDLDAFGHTTTLASFAAPGVTLSVGQSVTVGDDDGNLCTADVIDLGEDGTVSLVVHMGNFAAASGRARATV
jgi:hypothetical protein